MSLFKKEHWITVKEASDILQISPARIYTLMNNGRFRKLKNKFYKKYTKVSADDVEQYRIERESV